MGFDLLLDIINYKGSPVAAGFDVIGPRFDSVSAVAGHSQTAGTPITEGLVVQFEYAPIPDPTILSLYWAALWFGLCVRGWETIRRPNVCL